MYISEIVAFHCDGNLKDFCLLFKVAPTPTTGPKPPGEGGDSAKLIRRDSKDVANGSHLMESDTLKPSHDSDTKSKINSLSRFWKRADEETWNKCHCKGTKLLEGMRGTNEEASKLFDPQRATAQSQFKEKGEQRSLISRRQTLNQYRRWLGKMVLERRRQDWGVQLWQYQLGEGHRLRSKSYWRIGEDKF